MSTAVAERPAAATPPTRAKAKAPGARPARTKPRQGGRVVKARRPQRRKRYPDAAALQLGYTVRDLRRARRWTQLKLATIAGLDDKGRSYVSHLENGLIKRPRPDFIKKLAAAFAVDPKVFFDIIPDYGYVPDIHEREAAMQVDPEVLEWLATLEPETQRALMAMGPYLIGMAQTARTGPLGGASLPFMTGVR